MAKGKVNLVSQVHSTVIAAKKVYARLESSSQWLGRKFSIFADDHICKPWNEVAKKIVNTLPISLAVMSIPLPLTALLGLGFWGASVGWGPFSDSTHEHVMAGFTVGGIAVSLYNVVGFATTLKAGYLIGGVIYGVMAAVLLGQANFTNEEAQ